MMYATCFIAYVVHIRQIAFSGDIVNEEHHGIQFKHHFENKQINQDTISIPERPFKYIMKELDEVIILGTDQTSPLAKCAPTAQVKVKMNEDRWIVQTFDHLGREKNVGGDEMYVTYTDETAKPTGGNVDAPPTAVAFIEDLNNGQYRLKFSTTPLNPIPNNLSGGGTLKIYFDFTCSIGMLPPPTKLRWKHSGATNRNGEGRVKQPAMNTFIAPQLPNFNNLPLVVFFGDSTMLQMIKDRKRMEELQTEENIFLKPNVFFHANIRTEFSMEKMNYIKKKFQVMHRKQMLKYERDVSIVIGSAIWDILVPDVQSAGFEDHLEACKFWVEYLRKTYRGRTLYWKSPSALHMHRVNCTEANYELEACLNSTRYLSNSRVRALHQKQKALMNELNMPYLDLFDTYYLSAYYTAEGDGRHYAPELNEMILDQFYPQNETKVSAL